MGKASERRSLNHRCAWLAGAELAFKAPRKADRRAQLVNDRGRHLIAVCVAYPGGMLWSSAYLDQLDLEAMDTV
jgi:hypothetical protein